MVLVQPGGTKNFVLLVLLTIQSTNGGVLNQFFSYEYSDRLRRKTSKFLLLLRCRRKNKFFTLQADVTSSPIGSEGYILFSSRLDYRRQKKNPSVSRGFSLFNCGLAELLVVELPYQAGVRHCLP